MSLRSMGATLTPLKIPGGLYIRSAALYQREGVLMLETRQPNLPGFPASAGVTQSVHDASFIWDGTINQRERASMV
jgi:hypothetical protein